MLPQSGWSLPFTCSFPLACDPNPHIFYIKVGSPLASCARFRGWHITLGLWLHGSPLQPPAHSLSLEPCPTPEFIPSSFYQVKADINQYSYNGIKLHAVQPGLPGGEERAAIVLAGKSIPVTTLQFRVWLGYGMHFHNTNFPRLCLLLCRSKRSLSAVPP